MAPGIISSPLPSPRWSLPPLVRVFWVTDTLPSYVLFVSVPPEFSPTIAPVYKLLVPNVALLIVVVPITWHPLTVPWRRPTIPPTAWRNPLDASDNETATLLTVQLLTVPLLTSPTIPPTNPTLALLLPEIVPPVTSQLSIVLEPNISPTTAPTHSAPVPAPVTAQLLSFTFFMVAVLLYPTLLNKPNCEVKLLIVLPLPSKVPSKESVKLFDTFWPIDVNDNDLQSRGSVTMKFWSIMKSLLTSSANFCRSLGVLIW